MVILCLMVIQCPLDSGGATRLFSTMCNWYSNSFPLSLVIVFFIIDKSRVCEVVFHGFQSMSLINYHVEHHFIYLLAICISSLENFVFISFVILKWICIFFTTVAL